MTHILWNLTLSFWLIFFSRASFCHHSLYHKMVAFSLTANRNYYHLHQQVQFYWIYKPWYIPFQLYIEWNVWRYVRNTERLVVFWNVCYFVYNNNILWGFVSLFYCSYTYKCINSSDRIYNVTALKGPVKSDCFTSHGFLLSDIFRFLHNNKFTIL